ncbi:hypothetical protein MRGA327_07185 [Mycobacterium tuberculosis RGTB327]|nr:hypothetical protein MRGA327_07185 [Mycobacterium tuberculosis RGTB327]
METPGRQAVSHRNTEDRCGDEDEDRKPDDSARRSDGEPSDPLQHVAFPPQPVLVARTRTKSAMTYLR